jgi:hypothetical protein
MSTNGISSYLTVVYEVAVERKTLDQQKQAGEQAVALIDAASQLPQQQPPPPGSTISVKA